MTSLVMDASERAHLDTARHADKPVAKGIRWVHDPSTYGARFGALMLDGYCDTTIAVPVVLPRNARTQGYGYGMLDNDLYGDCMYAAMYHCQESLRLRWGLAPWPWAAKTCLAAYFAGNGQQPCPPGGPGDQGSDPAVAMGYWQSTGLPGHKIVAWGYVPAGSPNTRRLIYELGAGVMTLALGTQQQSQGVDFVYTPGETCGSWGGHAIDGDSYDEHGFGVINWSEEGTVDNPFEATCGQGWFFPLTTAALNSADVGPGGVQFSQMRSDLAALSQGRLQLPATRRGPGGSMSETGHHEEHEEHERGDVWEAIHNLRRDISDLQEQNMAEQTQIDALTTELTQVAADLAASSTALQTEIDNLAAANPGINLAPLQAIADTLDPAAKAIGALAPTPPPPPPPVTLFAFSGDPTIPVDPAVWAKATVTEAGGQALYTLLPGAIQPTDPAWTVYTGPTA